MTKNQRVFHNSVANACIEECMQVAPTYAGGRHVEQHLSFCRRTRVGHLLNTQVAGAVEEHADHDALSAILLNDSFRAG